LDVNRQLSSRVDSLEANATPSSLLAVRLSVLENISATTTHCDELLNRFDNIQQSPAVWVHVHAALSERVTAIGSNATFSGDITSRFVMLEKRVSSAEMDCAKKKNISSTNSAATSKARL